MAAVGHMFKKVFEGIGNAIKNVVEGAINVVKNIGEGVKNLATGNFSGLVKNLWSAGKSAFNIAMEVGPLGRARTVFQLGKGLVKMGAEEAIGGVPLPSPLKMGKKGGAQQQLDPLNTTNLSGGRNLWKN